MARFACAVVCLLALALPASARDAPEIARSSGTEGGVVVFWPRVIPRSETVRSRDLARAIQRRLIAFVNATLPERPADVRPEPERVCPKKGCRGATAGALLLRKASSCVVIGLFAGPGRAPTMMVPWVGEVRLKTNVVAFREPPESEVTVVDWALCAEVEAQLDTTPKALVRALRAAAS